ncbi:MAG: hypothetical protein KBF26_11095 [Opitutaceae bacterium]|nr:hypothetical protein [Opitutaceae bacterium]
MKTRVLFFLAVNLVTLSGCATATSTRSVTANLAAEHGASAALVETLQRGGRLSLADIERLTILKVPDDTTLAYLRRNGAAYELTLVQIDQMRNAGVSERVIDYLLASPARVARIVRYPRMRFGFGYPHYGGGHYSGGFGHGFGHGSFAHRGGHH